jgi:endoglucanase
MWKVVSLCGALAIAASGPVTPPPQNELRPIQETQFRRGVNILGYDPFWKTPAKARFKAKHFTDIRNGGFDFVRVNLFVFDHMDLQNRIDPKWLKRLDWVVANATKARLGVILDEHDFGTCANDVAACRDKLPAAWLQLSQRYRSQPSTVAFELLNEPSGQLDSKTWNEMIPRLLSIVRATNPTRTVIIGPTHWYSLSALPELQLPTNDQHITVTFHYYGPYRFTHQGAPWTKIKDLRGVTWGSAEDRAALRNNFEKVGAWALENQRPVLLGEFGAFDKGGTPIEMRAKYIGAVACEAERHGFGWAYWQFDGNFIVWDLARDEWVAPIKDALIDRGPSSTNC